MSVEKVDWKKLENNLGEKFNSSPLPLIKEKAEGWTEKCEIVEINGGEVFIKAGQKLDSLYIVLDGRVGIGGKSNGVYCERLYLHPFSFLGDFEAALVIDRYNFKNNPFQDNAWVSSNNISMMMGFKTEEKNVSVPENRRSNYLNSLKFFIGSDTLDKIFDSSDVDKGEINGIKFKNSYEGKITIEISEKELFARGAKAKLLKIPSRHLQDLWGDHELQKFISKDSFIKSKRYCYLSDLQRPGQKIIALYNYAHVNNLLINDCLYIFGPERLVSLINDSEASKAEIRRRIKNEIKKESFDWSELHISRGEVCEIETGARIEIDDQVKRIWEVQTPKGKPDIYRVKKLDDKG